MTPGGSYLEQRSFDHFMRMSRPAYFSIVRIFCSSYTIKHKTIINAVFYSHIDGAVAFSTKVPVPDPWHGTPLSSLPAAPFTHPARAPSLIHHGMLLAPPPIRSCSPTLPRPNSALFLVLRTPPMSHAHAIGIQTLHAVPPHHHNHNRLPPRSGRATEIYLDPVHVSVLGHRNEWVQLRFRTRLGIHVLVTRLSYYYQDQ